MARKNPLKRLGSAIVRAVTSRTVLGAAVTAGAWLVQQPKVGAIEILQALGVIVAANGAREAIRKGPAAAPTAEPTP